MIYLGIDPGKSGAVAVYDSRANTLEVLKCPETETGMADLIHNHTHKAANVECYIEKVHGGVFGGAKGQKAGSVSMFNFGRNFGGWLGILAAFQIRTHTVPPKKWQGKMGDLPKDKDKRKNEIHQRMEREFPSVRIYKYAADAVAILAVHVDIKI